MNSFRALHRALAYEEERQRFALEQGEKIVQETRHWDDVAGKTSPLRSKEEAFDYRYFPEPDLVPVEIAPAWLDGAARDTAGAAGGAERFIEQYGLSRPDALAPGSSHGLAEYYEAVVGLGAGAKPAAMGDGRIPRPSQRRRPRGRPRPRDRRALR